ncbi:5-methylcytosine-specific restriction endonuclease McrA [Metabacillus crassostreae]|uniref:HNH endonuclease domain-containing protein n=1 Tax=Metabacillus crassostreae TaxID=929098 RepID=UPI00195CFB7E|nr:HNH endonuclease domain-containing protein [Metabacillus crassostreae]MBM7602804.1 5-methylcytosine-specific restriction endonuclease McrA [Metabacillus crassostreae]
MGHKLKVGELREIYLTDEEIWRIFTIVLSKKSVKSSTYKYALIKALIENLYQINEDFELKYDQLAYSFSKIYWNLVVHHNLLNQNSGQTARVVSIIKEEQIKSAIPTEMVFDKLDDTLQIKLINKVKTTMKINVFGALYGDTRGSFYAFDHKKETLKLNPAVHGFMLNYQRLLVNLTNYHMAAMIEQLNEVPSINYLLGKVESIAKRSSLKPFEKVLLTYFQAECFYCGKKLSDNKRETHVDHFIPWSFVQSDHIWNLVLACNKCNSSKSDKLPTRRYLEFIIDRNQALTDKKEDTSITTLMSNYKTDKIIMLYEYSIKNGFDTVWIPQKA